MSAVLDRPGQASDRASSGRAGNASFSEMPAQPAPFAPSPWPALLVTRTDIEREVERLLDLDRKPGERRASEIVHPKSRDGIPGVNSGMSISINVIRPGEQLDLYRDNAARVEFVPDGEGTVESGHSALELAKWSVTLLPSMSKRSYRNSDNQKLVWLSYSNVPLLQRRGAYYSDNLDSAVRPPLSERSGIEQKYMAKTAPDCPILNDGARMRDYEFVTDVEVVENKPLVLPMERDFPIPDKERGGRQARPHVPGQSGDRTAPGCYAQLSCRIVAFTGRLSASCSATRPQAQLVRLQLPFRGIGQSIVDGEHFAWEAGDLMLSAPSWSEHAHGFTGASALTVQDQTFHMEMESLIWQEEMDGPILTLGSESGQTGYVGPREAGK